MDPEMVQVLLEEYESLKRLLEQVGIMGEDI